MHGETTVGNISENNLQIEPGKKFFTAQARRAHVREYQTSGESMIVYCDKHHLALSTFKTWVTKYGEKKIPAQFVPIATTLKNSPTEINEAKSLSRVEIHKGDIKIVVFDTTKIETLIQLIKGLSYANHAQSTSNIVL